MRFIASDVTQLGTMQLGDFDIIFCLAVLEHIRDDVALLQQIQRMLRPGGLLVLEVPSAERRTLAAKEEEDGHERPGYVVDDIQTLLARTGLHLISQCSMDPFGLIYYWNKLSLRDARVNPLLKAVLGPVFVPLIRLSSRVVDRPGDELCFLAAND